MSAGRLSAAVGILAALSSCTLIGLSNKIQQAPCSTDADCEVLNDHADPYFDFCHPYMCSAAQSCDREPLDQDHDGFVADRCEPDVKRRDCDDSRAEAHPGADEICNAKDDDCDQRIDEGLLQVHTSMVVDFGVSAAVTSLGFAPDLEQPQLAVGYIQPNGNIAATELGTESANLVIPQVLSLPKLFDAEPMALTLGLGHLPKDPFAVAAYLADRVPRVILGSVALPDPTLLTTQQVGTYGLACALEESCAQAVATVPSDPRPVPPSGDFAIASGVAGTLAVYARSADPLAMNPCAATSEVPGPHLLLANMLSNDSGNLVELAPAAGVIATLQRPGAVSVLALPRGRTNLRHGFLVAYADDSGNLAIQQVSVRDAAIQVSDTLLQWPADHGAWHSPQFALGEATTSSAGVGIVAARGCGPDARIVAAQLALQLHDDGSVAVQVADRMVELSETPGQHAPAIAWNPLQQAWGVSYRDDAGVRVRVLNNAFQLTGVDSLIVDAHTSLAAGTADQTAIVGRTNSAGFFAVFHQAPTDHGSYGLARAAIDACAR